MNEISFQIRVPIGRDWRNVELLRTSILNCLAAVFHDTDFCQSVGMIAGELIENAIKYGKWSDSDPGSFTVDVQGNHERVAIEVCNPVPSRDDVQKVRAVLERLRSFPSAREAYLERLREVASTRGRESGGLGLLRMAYEGACDLEASEEHQLLRMRATTRPSDAAAET
jgi:hypothetical protein